MERMYYSPTFKAGVLTFYDVHRDAGWTAARVARKFKMNANTLRAWINEGEETDSDDGDMTSQRYSRQDVIRLIDGIKEDVANIMERLEDSIVDLEEGRC